MVESNSMRFRTPSAFKAESSPAELTFHNLAQNISVFIRVQEYYSRQKLQNLVPHEGIEPPPLRS